MATIYVDFDYSSNHITLGSKKIFNISNIRSIFDGATVVGTHDTMKKEQQILNYLDSIKDGANAYTLQQLNIYPEVSGNWPSFPIDLLGYEANIKNALRPYISNITWTKLKKKQALNPPLIIENIFRDCGIGADVFIATGFKLFSTIATYIDPATRATPDVVWPSRNETIIFNKNIMELFGLENSSLKSKTLSMERFAYEIVSNGIQFINDGVKTDTNMNYFGGNTNKNSLLKQTKTSTDEKKALISLKEWGDKMQVVMLFIWTFLNKRKSYTMITCDKVVYTLCMLLSVKCIFTGQINEGDIRKYSIEIFEPSENPITDAYNRYYTKQQEIIQENNNFISMIDLLRANPNQSIYIDGVTEPITIISKFYENVYDDISKIQATLKLQQLRQVQTYSNVSDIENETNKLKQNYLLLPFIRKIKTRIKLLRNVNYTFTTKQKPSFDFSEKSFYDIIMQRGFKKQFPQIMRRTAGGGPYKYTMPTNKALSVDNPWGKYTYAITNIRNVIDSDLFNDSDFYDSSINYSYYDNIPVDKESNPDDQYIDSLYVEKNVDLNEVLRNQVKQIAINNKYNKFFDSIYSMVLLIAYIHDGIPLDGPSNGSQVQSQLEVIINNYIIKEYLSLPTVLFTTLPISSAIPHELQARVPLPLSAGGKKKKRKSKNRKSKKRKSKKRKSKKNQKTHN